VPFAGFHSLGGYKGKTSLGLRLSESLTAISLHCSVSEEQLPRIGNFRSPVVCHRSAKLGIHSGRIGLKSCLQARRVDRLLSAPKPLNDAQTWGLLGEMPWWQQWTCPLCRVRFPTLGYDGSIPSSPLYCRIESSVFAALANLV